MEAKRVEAIAIESSTNDTITSPSTTTIPKAGFEIPMIDMEEPDEERLARLIAKASIENGVFQITNHGVPNEVIAKLQSVGKEFFELSEKEKEVYGRSAPRSMEGYGTKTSTLKDQAIVAWCDNLVHKVWPPSSINYQYWPKNPPSYREANEEYAKHLRCVSDKLFRCLSLGLGLEGHELKEAVGGEGLEYVLMINHFPPCPRLDDLALGLPPHTDMCAMTLLVPNEVQGLQLCKDGHWFDVKYVPNAIIIHIGDQIEIMSNGKYKSMLHRTTIDKEKTRMSWPVFLNPPQDLIMGPIPTLINEEKPAKYKSKKYGDYVYCKMNKLPQ